MIRSILSKVFGTLFFLISKEKRRVALQNIDYVYGDSLSTSEKRKMAHSSFLHIARTFVDLLFSCRDIEKEIEIEEGSFNIPDKAKYICFVGHQGNWEWMTQYLAKKHPHGSCVYQPNKKTWLNTLLEKKRLKWGGHLIDRNYGMNEIMRWAKKGPIVTIADQSVLRSSYSYSFLGKRAWISPAPALLAIKTNMPIVVCTSRRIRNKLKLFFSYPIYPQEEGSVKEKTFQLMNTVMHKYEQRVKIAPEQYMWGHDQWKQEKVHFKKKSLGIREVHVVTPKANEKQAQAFQDYFSRCTFKVFESDDEVSKEKSIPQLVLDFSHSKKLKKQYQCPVIAIPSRDDWNPDEIYAFFKAQHVTP